MCNCLTAVILLHLHVKPLWIQNNVYVPKTSLKPLQLLLQDAWHLIQDQENKLLWHLVSFNLIETSKLIFSIAWRLCQKQNNFYEAIKIFVS